MGKGNHVSLPSVSWMSWACEVARKVYELDPSRYRFRWGHNKLADSLPSVCFMSLPLSVGFSVAEHPPSWQTIYTIRSGAEG